MSNVSRRELLAKVGLAGIAAAIAPEVRAKETAQPDHEHDQSEQAEKSGQNETQYLFFNREEAQFIEAAVARLIPTDDYPGGVEACVSNYLDKQLGGAWGAGERLYRSGPWLPTRPGLGYQLPLTPGELFHTAIKAINAELAKSGRPFWEMSPEQQDEYLRQLENGKIDLNDISSDIFFSQLWGMTVEGFFSDPVYGGNKDMLGWKMIGFPGAYASYYDLIDQHGIKFQREPVSLGQHDGHFMPDPNIPAYSPHQ
jgi:gluconate 2-dehydrogenase gamma chain